MNLEDSLYAARTAPDLDLPGMNRCHRALARLWPMVIALCLAAPGSASAIVVNWASSGALTDGGGAAGIVGSPDASIQGSSAWRASRFNDPVHYVSLAQTLGLSEARLAGYDLLAWEANGGSPAASGGWESSAWVFSANGASVAAEFNEVTGAGNAPGTLFLTGSITGAQYNALFATSAPPAEVWSWLLIKAPASIDAHAPDFAVDFAAIGGRPGWGEGTPDPDAIGVLASVPEPGTWGLVTIALAALFRGRWSRLGRARSAPRRPLIPRSNPCWSLPRLA